MKIIKSYIEGLKIGLKQMGNAKFQLPNATLFFTMVVIIVVATVVYDMVI